MYELGKRDGDHFLDDPLYRLNEETAKSHFAFRAYDSGRRDGYESIREFLNTYSDRSKYSKDDSRILALEVENLRCNLNSKFVGALTTKRVHEKHCRFANNIKEQNKVVFKFERDARKQGYKPCKCLN